MDNALTVVDAVYTEIDEDMSEGAVLRRGEEAAGFIRDHLLGNWYSIGRAFCVLQNYARVKSGKTKGSKYNTALLEKLEEFPNIKAVYNLREVRDAAWLVDPEYPERWEEARKHIGVDKNNKRITSPITVRQYVPDPGRRPPGSRISNAERIEDLTAENDRLKKLVEHEYGSDINLDLGPQEMELVLTGFAKDPKKRKKLERFVKIAQRVLEAIPEPKKLKTAGKNLH